MASTQKRKSPSGVEHAPDEASKRRLIEPEDDAGGPVDHLKAPNKLSTDRLDRFNSLRARRAASETSNRKAKADEDKRQQAPTSQLPGLARKHARASQALLKADMEADGEDFERKRAWDWTAAESEAWDRHVAKKERHRQGVAFADYGAEARKKYKRQLREAAPPDLDEYARGKMAAIEQAAAAGGLEIVETEDGELVAIDVGGGVLGDGQGIDFATHKPSKESVDRLVADMRRDEAAELKKRRDRRRAGEDGDVSYINEKNKQFNDKLARFYNKYTVDIRESFERGTAI